MSSDRRKKRIEGELVGELVRIRQRGKNWFANFQHNGKQCRPSLKSNSKKEARRKALKIEAALLEGRFQETTKAPSIKKVTEDYVAHLRTERKAKKTIAKVELVIRRILNLAERGRARTIVELNLRFVDAYRSERVDAGAKPKTVLNESVILRQIVNFALQRELITADPLRNLKLRKVKSATQPCWSREELHRILGLAEEPCKPPLVILAETGMRIGEVKHLTWDDVDFEHAVLHVRPKEGWQPKTGDQRAVPMSPTVRRLLESLPRRRGWVFTARPSQRYPGGDHQISERRLLQYLKRVLKRLNLRGHLHTFRHAFISNAITKGTPEAVVRQWVGHVDADILKLYTHIADKDSQAAMQRLAEADTKQLKEMEAK
jgi:integrase